MSCAHLILLHSNQANLVKKNLKIIITEIAFTNKTIYIYCFLQYYN